VQDPSTYSVVGTTLTFSAAPPSGTGNISVRYMGIPASGVTTTAYRTVTEFTATAGQTTFSVPSYTVGYIDVYRNGSRLGTADFTATNGTTVVLAAAATAGDLIATESFYVSSVLNAIPATAGAVNSTYMANGAALANIGTGGLTQAYLGAGVAGNGPAFSAWKSANQTISSATDTKITFDTEEFDTASCFDTSTSRFTPNVAGYYQVNFQCDMGGVTTTAGIMNVRKNGTGAKRSQGVIGPNMTEQYLAGRALIYMNGTTDYVEIYVYTNGTSPSLAPAVYNTYFFGSMARGA
jgi:hypothetical protein